MSFKVGDRVNTANAMSPKERDWTGTIIEVDGVGDALVAVDQNHQVLWYSKASLNRIYTFSSGPMTSADLADEVAEFVQGARGRITGVGKEQYDDGRGQKFERMSITELCDWALEELQDVACYATMLAIRIKRVKESINGAE